MSESLGVIFDFAHQTVIYLYHDPDAANLWSNPDMAYRCECSEHQTYVYAPTEGAIRGYARHPEFWCPHCREGQVQS